MATSIKTYTIIPDMTNSSSYVSILSSITVSLSGHTWSVPYNQDNSEKLQFLGASLIDTTLGSLDTKITKIRINYEDKVSNSNVNAHCCFWLGRSSVDGDGPDLLDNVFTMSSPYEYYDNYDSTNPWNSSSYTVWESESGTRSTSFTSREVILYSNTDYSGIQLTARDFAVGGRGLIIGLGTVNNSMQSGDLTVRNITVTIEYEIEVETCTVTISSNNTSQGTVSGGAANIELGTSVTIKATPRSGYVFSYWLSDSGVYQFTSTYTYNATEDAHWTAYFSQDTSTTTYTIQFNGNGHTGGSLPSTMTAEGTSTSVKMGDISSNVPVRDGYIFRGWSSTSSYSSKRIAYSSSYGGSADSNGVSATTTGDWTYQNYCDNTGYTGTSTTLTLYAQWEADTAAATYTLTIDGDWNGYDSYSSITPSVGSYSCRAGDTISLSATLKSGYSVLGWLYKKASDESWNWIVLDSLTGTYTMPAENVHIALYTNKTTTTYTIQFNGNGHTGGSIPSTITAEGTSTSVTMGDISSAVPTRTGYIFRGWSSTSSYSSKRIAWTESCGGSADSNGIKATTTGNTWTYQNYCDYTGYTGTSTTLTLYAQWEQNTYTVSYNKGTYGSGTDTTDAKTHGIALTLKGAIFTRTGYTQTGWASNQAGTTFAYNLNASYTTDAAVTLYPYWTINTYQFTLGSATHVNTTGSTASGIKNYGTTITLKATVDAGYEFAGWVSSNTNLISNLSAANTSFNMPDGKITMTPSVKAKSYTITYDIASNANSGDTLTNKPSTQTYSYTGGTVTITSTTPKRIGYTFKGWCRNKNSASNLLNSGTTINQETNNITLYAVWEKSITIQYNINEGTGAVPTQQTIVVYNTATGTSFGTLATNTGFSRPGYTFAGWSTTKNNSSTKVSGTTTFTNSTTTLYALWDINYYSVSTNIYTNGIDSDNGNSISSPTLVSGSTQSGKYAYGSEIKLTATAVDPYDFESWSQNGIDKGSGTISNNGNKSECNFTITGNTTIIANFATGTISARFYCYDITSGSSVQTSDNSKVKLWVRSKAATASTYGAWEQKSFSTKMTYSNSTYIQVLIENGEEYEFNPGTGINFAYTIPNQLTDILIQSDQNFSIPCKKIKTENHIKVNDVLKTSGYIKDPYFSMDENIASVWIGDKQIMGQAPSKIYPYKEDSLLIDTLYINNLNTNFNKSYQNNTSIKKVIIPQNITTIGSNYLRECTNLRTVKFLQNSQLTSLGNYAFAQDTNLLKIYLPNKLTNIGEGAFQECTKLQKIVLPKTISTIQQYAFYNCTNLQSLKLNHTTIMELPYSLFMYCSNLKTVFLPKTLTAIGERVFYQCTSLEKIIYMGTIEDWNKISITSNGNTYLNGVPIQCVDGITYTNLE